MNPDVESQLAQMRLACAALAPRLAGWEVDEARLLGPEHFAAAMYMHIRSDTFENDAIALADPEREFDLEWNTFNDKLEGLNSILYRTSAERRVWCGSLAVGLATVLSQLTSDVWFTGYCPYHDSNGQWRRGHVWVCGSLDGIDYDLDPYVRDAVPTNPAKDRRDDPGGFRVPIA